MYQAIHRQFNKQGLSEENKITEYEIKRALDSISSKNSGVPQFDNEVAHEIWNETKDSNPHGEIKLKDYILTMVKAQNILREQIELTQQQLRTDLSLQQDHQRKNELLNNLFSYSQDHRTITIPFGLQQIQQTKQIQQSKLRNSHNPSKSILFSQKLDQREQSTDLKIFLLLTLGLLALELVLMYAKHHFFTLLVISLIICAYVLGHFEKKFVIGILVGLLVSIILDFIWMIVKSSSFWSTSDHNIQGNLHVGFLRFVVFMVVIEMAIKVVLIGLLFKYKEISSSVRKKVNIFGLVFNLNGKEEFQNNLFTKLFIPKEEGLNPFQS